MINKTEKRSVKIFQVTLFGVLLVTNHDF